MSNGIYVGVDDKARKMTGGYIGVGGKARKILKIYEGVDNVAKLAWQGKKPKVWLTFSSTMPASLKTANESKNWDGELLYSTDTKSWKVWNGEEIQFKAQLNDVCELYLAGYGNTYLTNKASSDSTMTYFIMTGSVITCNGNIETLLDCDEVYYGGHPTMADSCYAYMFYNCTSLVTAPKLPAIRLTQACYEGMFSSCTSLTTAPELPATTLAKSCYSYMFQGCTSLNLYTTSKSYSWTAPASTYTGSMFSSCKLDGSTFPNSGTPTEGITYYWDIPGLVNKGDIIKMDLDGNGEKEFRVLKAWGNKAEVLTMWNLSTSMAFDANNTNTYSGNTLDTYLNTTWYNTLTSTAKAAIVPKNINQYQYSYSSSAYNQTTHSSYADYSTKSLKANVGNRYVYALDVEDIEMYFGGTGGSASDKTRGTFSKTDLLQMFWNQTSTISEYPWSRSANAGLSSYVWCVDGGNGNVGTSYAGYTYAVRGALQIDLTKIDYTIST